MSAGRAGGHLAAALAATCLALAACGDPASVSEVGVPGPGGGTGPSALGCALDDDCAPGERCAGGQCVLAGVGASGPGDGLGGGETEDDSFLESPARSARFVFLVDRALGALVRIDPDTLAVAAIDVGVGPTLVRTVYDDDTAVVLNVGSRSLSVVRAPAAAMARGGAEVVEVPLGEAYTDLALSPDGRVAVAYFGPSSMALAPDAVRAKLALVELPVGPIAAGVPAPALVEVATGGRVTDLVFDAASAHVYVVGRAELADIALSPLGGEGPPRQLALPTDVARAEDREVEATADGAYVLLRARASAQVHVVDTAAFRVRTLDAGRTPGDVDLSGRAGDAFIVAVVPPRPAEGAQGEALAGRTLVAPLPAAFDDSEAVRVVDTGTLAVGQVALPPAGGGRRAVLFTNAQPSRDLVWLDLDTGALSPQPELLVQAIAAVAIAPGGATAVVLSRPVASDSTDPTERAISAAQGYALVSLEAGLAVPQVTAAQPGSLIFAEDGARAALLVGDTELHRLDLERLLVAGVTPLETRARHLGLLPGGRRAFVGQRHPAGRVSFVELDSGELRRVTGFLLNAQVE